MWRADWCRGQAWIRKSGGSLRMSPWLSLGFAAGTSLNPLKSGGSVRMCPSLAGTSLDPQKRRILAHVPLGFVGFRCWDELGSAQERWIRADVSVAGGDKLGSAKAADPCACPLGFRWVSLLGRAWIPSRAVDPCGCV